MAHVATITIDHTKVPGDLTDYVGLIVPDGSAGYSALYALCLEGGGDIRLFKSDDTTELAREIVTFSVSAETGEIHYKYSGTLSSSVDTPIHVYADGSSADYAVTATYGRNNVWTDYVSVWHMSESNATRVDSTGNNDMPQFNSVLSGTGKIGNGADFERSNSEYLRITDAAQTGLDMPGDFTLQTWYELETASIVQVFASKSAFPAIGMQWYLDSSNKLFCFASSDGATSQRSAWGTTAAIPTSGLHLQHLTFDAPASGNPTVTFYIDGASVAGGTAWASGMSGGMSNNSNNFAIASEPGQTGNSLDGILDEMRIRTGLLLDNHIAAEYNNQNSYSTFYSVAAVAGGSAAQAARRGVIMMM